jgi:CubicO group peptidase (beta-lactamase class C family)
LLILVLCAVAGCGGGDKRERAATAGSPLTSAIAKDLDAALAEKVEATGVPGAAASVVFADGKQWSGAAGDAVLKPRRAMTTDTSFPFDSVTKMAVAALAMRLVEQDKLALDDPIRRWYPRWRGDPAATVRDLLGHTSGLGDPPPEHWIDVVGHPRRPVTARDYLAATPKPGPRTEAAEYSNAGYLVLGMVLARAASEDVTSALRREVLGDGLAFQPGERAHEPHAHSYWYPRNLTDRVDATDRSGLLPRRHFSAMTSTAGALAGDVPSLARWADALFAGDVVSDESLREMTRFHAGAFWEGYGLGVAKAGVDDHELWGHTGDGLGSHTELWHLPKEDLTIAVSWNDDVIDSDGQILPELVRAALGDYQR